MSVGDDVPFLEYSCPESSGWRSGPHTARRGMSMKLLTSLIVNVCLSAVCAVLVLTIMRESPISLPALGQTVQPSQVQEYLTEPYCKQKRHEDTPFPLPD